MEALLLWTLETSDSRSSGFKDGNKKPSSEQGGVTVRGATPSPGPLLSDTCVSALREMAPYTDRWLKAGTVLLGVVFPLALELSLY